jgi:ADP-heptose:LPS heptosyltransferase
MLRQWSSVFPRTESVAGCLSLKEELELMRMLDVMICMDSANQHLSSLVGLRAISIWCATHPMIGFAGWKQDPNDIIQRQDLRCRPCSCHGTNHCRYRNYACRQIDAETIIQQI